MKFEIRTEGFRELDEALRELPKATAKNVLRRVAKAALEPMAEDARRRAPDDPSTPAPHDLRSSIAISEKRKTTARGFTPKTTAVRVYMGPTRDGYPEAMPQEFGSAPHSVARKRRRGKSGPAKMHPGNPPHPYMRPAFDAGWRPMLANIRTQLAAEIEKARARLARKAARLAAKNRS